MLSILFPFSVVIVFEYEALSIYYILHWNFFLYLCVWEFKKRRNKVFLLFFFNFPLAISPPLLFLLHVLVLLLLFVFLVPFLTFPTSLLSAPPLSPPYSSVEPFFGWKSLSRTNWPAAQRYDCLFHFIVETKGMYHHGLEIFCSFVCLFLLLMCFFSILQ